jgi:hypothetical protein
MAIPAAIPVLKDNFSGTYKNIDQRVYEIIRGNALRVALGYCVFALSVTTFWKVLAVAVIIGNINNIIATIISRAKNNKYESFENNRMFYHSSLNVISMLAIGYIHSASIINFIKYGI